MKLAIGAIFRNEFEYIIEWLTWHEIAGFKQFHIADNGSKDGSRELLEALYDLGRVKLLYQPVVEKKAQIRAYKRITQLSINEADAVLFIDADEFLTHESNEPGAEYAHLRDLLSDPDVGMVGINWRCFGSSGLQSQDSRPVVERFTLAASDTQNNPNQFLKSICKTKKIKKINPHSALLIEGHYVKPDSRLIDDFILMVDKKFVQASHSGRTKSISAAPLRINHYVIKSKQEYINKKERRGDAMLGVGYERGMSYFRNHDFKDIELKFPKKRIEFLKSKMSELSQAITSSTFGKILRGSLDISDADGCQGWLVDEHGESKGLKVNIFVNGVFHGSSKCGFYRPDLKDKNISKDGLSGFRWTHPRPLSSGDMVEVVVHANRYQFPQRSRTVID